MGNIGSGEVLVILVLGLLVLGPERLPEFARKIGNFIKEARRMSCLLYTSDAADE